MIQTGRMIRPAILGEGVRKGARSAHGAAISLRLPRPGQYRKDTCEAAPGFGRNGSFKVSRSHPVAVVRRQFPAPVLGLMETPAVVRRPFPVPCVGLMELYTHA